MKNVKFFDEWNFNLSSIYRELEASALVFLSLGRILPERLWGVGKIISMRFSSETSQKRAKSQAFSSFTSSFLGGC